MAQLSDGIIRSIYLSNENEFVIRDSKDGGKTWEDADISLTELEKVVSDFLKKHENLYVDQIVLDQEGDFAFAMRAESDEGEDENGFMRYITDYYFVSKDGRVKEIPLELPEERKPDENDMESGVVYMPSDTEFSAMRLVDAENLYILDCDGRVFHVSVEDGSILTSFTDTEYVNKIYICGDRLITLSADIVEYDLKTDQKIKEHADMGLWIQGDSHLADSISDDRKIYFLISGSGAGQNAGQDESGIYVYDLDTR